MAESRHIEHLNENFPKPVAIEAGHVYALLPHKERQAALLAKEFAIADEIGMLLKDHLLNPTKIVLVDETDAVTQQKHSSENGSRHLLFIGRELSRIDSQKPGDYELWRESEFHSDAQKLIERVKKTVRAFSDPDIRLSGANEARLKIGSNTSGVNISFFQKVAVNGGSGKALIPSCSLFDLAVYRQKLRDSSVAVTVLPHSFKKQQREVKELFAILGEDPSVVVVYVDDTDARVVEVEHWNSKAALVGNLIRVKYSV